MIEGLLGNNFSAFVEWARQNIRPKVKGVLVANYDARPDEIEEVYEKTLEDVVEDLLDGEFEGRSSLSTYFVQIALNRMATLIRKKIRDRKYRYIQVNLLAPEGDKQIDADQINLLKACIKKTPEPCRSILNGICNGESYKVIASRSDYSYQHIKNKARECKYYLKQLLIRNGF